ncbi:MAG: VPLPA-CTERM sorting domain-containing protein [Candidatus Thiodiazotropha sp.]
MRLSKTIGMAALAAAILHSTSAYSAVLGSLVFTNPTGTVGANDVIDVWVTLTLDTASDPLTFNSSAAYPNGVNPADIPTDGLIWDPNIPGYTTVPFDNYDYIGLSTSRSCNDTFTVVCSDPGSQYSYNAPSTHPSSWFNFSGTLNPGASMDFLLYELTPIAGGAASGTYELFTAGVAMNVYGTDIDGNSMDAEIYDFRTTCVAANCTFSRDVSPVPIPGAAWLFGSALIGLAGVIRKRA